MAEIIVLSILGVVLFFMHRKGWLNKKVLFGIFAGLALIMGATDIQDGDFLGGILNGALAYILGNAALKRDGDDSSNIIE